MSEQFVTYEIALKLKELGFDYECFGWFNTIQNELPEDGDHKEHVNIALYWDIEKALNDGYNCVLKAPLWQQAQLFLEEKYDLNIEVRSTLIKFYVDNVLQPIKYQYLIESTVNRDDDYLFHSADCNNFYNNKKDALIDAILKSIELIELKLLKKPN